MCGIRFIRTKKKNEKNKLTCWLAGWRVVEGDEASAASIIISVSMWHLMRLEFVLQSGWLADCALVAVPAYSVCRLLLGTTPFIIKLDSEPCEFCSFADRLFDARSPNTFTTCANNNDAGCSHYDAVRVS